MLKVAKQIPYFSSVYEYLSPFLPGKPLSALFSAISKISFSYGVPSIVTDDINTFFSKNRLDNKTASNPRNYDTIASLLAPIISPMPQPEMSRLLQEIGRTIFQ